MTEKESFLIVAAQLKQADVHLRAAMVVAGEAKMTNDIRESEWHLDEAIAHVEAHVKLVAKKVKKEFDKCP